MTGLQELISREVVSKVLGISEKCVRYWTVPCKMVRSGKETGRPLLSAMASAMIIIERADHRSGGAFHMYSIVKATRPINIQHARFSKAQSSESKLSSRGLNVAARGWIFSQFEQQAGDTRIAFAIRRYSLFFISSLHLLDPNSCHLPSIASPPPVQAITP